MWDIFTFSIINPQIHEIIWQIGLTFPIKIILLIKLRSMNDLSWMKDLSTDDCIGSFIPATLLFFLLINTVTSFDRRLANIKSALIIVDVFRWVLQHQLRINSEMVQLPLTIWQTHQNLPKKEANNNLNHLNITMLTIYKTKINSIQTHEIQSVQMWNAQRYRCKICWGDDSQLMYIADWLPFNCGRTSRLYVCRLL